MRNNLSGRAAEFAYKISAWTNVVLLILLRKQSAMAFAHWVIVILLNCYIVRLLVSRCLEFVQNSINGLQAANFVSYFVEFFAGLPASGCKIRLV